MIIGCELKNGGSIAPPIIFMLNCSSSGVSDHIKLSALWFVILTEKLITSWKSHVWPRLWNQSWRFCPHLFDQRILEPIIA